MLRIDLALRLAGEVYGGAFGANPRPDDAFFVIAQKYPITYFERGTPAALTYLVEKCRANADAGAIGEVVKSGHV